MSERDIFHAALAFSDPARRAVYLDQACAGDPALRTQVEGLLEVHSQLGNFLEGPCLGHATAADEPRANELLVGKLQGGPGTLIGPYRLLEQIGEGGFGTVFMAEQQRPMRRKVALKVVKAGMDTRQVIARFEVERQALALMEHTHIARVLDAGEMPGGRPYFVMELVRGRSLTEYCDDNNLPVRERLKLFLDVCAAVQHAHQKGVIHRDIKPSNVLVTLHDGRAVVKVIDFGIAKAVAAPLTDKVLFTNFAQMIGTPMYMSPEQAEMGGLDVDTRADIYSLGVLLYELLTGTTPFDKERLRQLGFDEIRRIIREEEPLRPSAHISTLGQAALTVSARRRSDPRGLSQVFRGEMDWIVMKALEKDRNRRYETAGAFAADVRRYLNDEPVQACPPTAGYRLRKFVRRNRGTVLAVTVVLAALLTGVTLSIWQAVRATLAERDAVAGWTQAEQKGNAAILAQQKADAEGIRAGKAETEARRRFYAAQMNLAIQAWESGNPARVLALLEGQRPGTGDEDFRGFEWYHLWRLCQSGRRYTLKSPAINPSCVAFSPDGKTLAVPGDLWAFRRWDLATGREQPPVGANVATVQSMTFARDGKTVVTGTLHGPVTLKAWDVETGQERGPASGRREEVWSVALSPDGTAVAVGGGDGAPIKIYDLATWQERHTLVGHQYQAYSVAFAPDGNTLATASGWGDEGGVVKLWDLTRQPPAVRLQLPGAMRVAFSPDGKTLATAGGAGSGGAVKIYDVVTGGERASFKGHVEACWVAFSPDGQSLVSGGNDRTVRLWDLRTQEQRACYGNTGPVHAVAFAPDGKTLASVGAAGTIEVWDVTPRAEEVVLPGAGILVAFSPDGKSLVTTGGTPAKLWEVAAWKQPGRGAAPAGPQAPPASPLPLSFDESTVPADSPVFSHNGKTLAFALGRTVKLYDVDTRRELAALEGPTTFWGLAFSDDDQSLASTSHSQPTAKVWDLATRKVRTNVTPHPVGPARAVAYSPDGKTLATGSMFGVVKLWDAATGRERATLRSAVTDGMVWVYAVAFSPNGKVLAAADRQGEVRLWNLEGEALPAILKGHTDAVFCLAFSRDGHTLATGGDDATVKLWDVATAQEKITLKGHKAAVRSVAFAPDDTLLAAGSADGNVRLWRAAVDPEALARRVGAGRITEAKPAVSGDRPP